MPGNWELALIYCTKWSLFTDALAANMVFRDGWQLSYYPAFQTQVNLRVSSPTRNIRAEIPCKIHTLLQNIKLCYFYVPLS